MCEPKTELKCDIVIAGAGTAGCEIAKLLAAHYKVIVIDTGVDESNDPIIVNPQLGQSVGLAQRFNRFYQTIGYTDVFTPTDKQLPGVEANVLGGGSSVNGTQMVLGTRSYFQRLANYLKDPAWGPENVERVYKNLETFHGIPGQFTPSAHGFNGPLSVRQASANPGIGQAFVQAMVNLGYPQITDYNDFNQPIGAFLYWQLSQNPSGTRADSYSAFLKPILQRADENRYVSRDPKYCIELYTKAHLVKVLFPNETKESKKCHSGCNHAYGTRGCHYKGAKSDGIIAVLNGVETLIRAHVVIVTTGFLTPFYLEVSGILDEALARKQRIPLVVDSPNTGQHLLNHPIASITTLGSFNVNTDPTAIFAGGAFIPDPTSGNSERAFQILTVPVDQTPITVLAAVLLDAKAEGYIIPTNSDPLRSPTYYYNYFNNEQDINSGVALLRILYNATIEMGFIPLGIPFNPTDADLRAYLLATYDQAYHWTGPTRMAPSIKEGVVASNGRVFGTRNVFAADATTFPFNPLGNTQVPAYLAGQIDGEAIDKLFIKKKKKHCGKNKHCNKGGKHH